ncbi:CDP-glucose 4,6-dehydratase [Planktomarina sp.]|nr:CDP-glucose 4,6-dehydratase [Planktomarina temperata]MDC3221728.1 CDP-glucose 4,6-dehydratase [Planktomarina sp.]
MFNSVYKDKKVLITGHTGFKGSWLSVWLNNLGAKVFGLALDPNCYPSNYKVCELNTLLERDLRLDVTQESELKKAIHDIKPDFIFHLAAQALVKDSYENPVATMITNSIGTANLLNAIRDMDSRITAILITSDKCYDNIEWLWGYKETDRLGGKDPYSASKAMTEIAISSFVASYFPSEGNVRVGIGRAGNVIGGGDWSPDRIIPDCVKAWAIGETVDIRSPKATRPWQHVLEPLSGYLKLGCELDGSKVHHGEAFNFGPAASSNFSVEQLIDKMSNSWESVSWNDTSSEAGHFHEAGLLRLNCEKAQTVLDWHPVMDFSETVQMTSIWFKRFYETLSPRMLDITTNQIEQYTNLAAIRGHSWIR